MGWDKERENEKRQVGGGQGKKGMDGKGRRKGRDAWRRGRERNLVSTVNSKSVPMQIVPNLQRFNVGL